MNLIQQILIFGLRGYRRMISPMLTVLFGPMGFGCRFTPTCSCYAMEAVRTHGALRGSWLAVCRVGRCHPWGGQGEDPVPPRTPIVGASGRTDVLNSRMTAAKGSDSDRCSLSWAFGPDASREHRI